jgi:LysM repeat protein
MKALNLNEMENVIGGQGGSPTKLPDKKGYWVYRIKSGDCLSRIAGRYGTTAETLKRVNNTIHNINDITAGYYIYIPD